MRSPLKALRAVTSSIVKLIPISILTKIEDYVQKQLGKGSGAWSTSDEAKEICRLVAAKSIKEVVAIDAGANVGNWSSGILDALPSSRVIAFEPSKKAFSELVQRFSGRENFKAFNVALGKVNAKTTLFADESGSGLGSLSKRRVDHFNINFSHEEIVDVKTLDDFIAAEFSEFVPNVLKMDVEGHELDVLLGASAILSSIQVVQFEFGGSNIDSRTYFQDFWYFFREKGFDLYRLTPRGSVLISEYSERDETFRATNYFAVRR